MKKTIEIYYPLGDGLDTRIRDECITQSRGETGGTLKQYKKVEVIGSRMDGRDFDTVIEKLCEKYKIKEEQLFILEEQIEELCHIINDNQMMNAENMMRKRVRARLGKIDSIFDYEGIDCYIDMSDCVSNGVDKAIYKYTIEVKKGTDLYEDIKQDFGSITEYFNSIDNEYKMTRNNIEDFTWDYPVDCERIYQDYCDILDNTNIKEELKEYFEDKAEEARKDSDKYREVAKQYA